MSISLSGEPSADFQSLSCFYTGLIPLSHNEALLVYSDFQYPNADGKPAKTILSRRITVVFED